MTAPAFAPAASMSRLFVVELRKTIDTRAGFWLLVSSALSIVATLAVTLADGHAEHQQLSVFFARAIATSGVLLPLLGVLAITSEWSQRTALTTFALVPQRERVVAAKLLAGLAVALATVVFCLVASLGATVLAPAFGHAASRWDLAASGVAAGVLYTTLWMLAGAALGLLVMSSAPAIVLSFLIPMSIAGLAAGIPGAHDALRWIDLGNTSGELAAAHPAVSAADWAAIASGVALWVLVPLAIGFIRLHRREVTSS